MAVHSFANSCQCNCCILRSYYKVLQYTLETPIFQKFHNCFSKYRSIRWASMGFSISLMDWNFTQFAQLATVIYRNLSAHILGQEPTTQSWEISRAYTMWKELARLSCAPFQCPSRNSLRSLYNASILMTTIMPTSPCLHASNQVLHKNKNISLFN